MINREGREGGWVIGEGGWWRGKEIGKERVGARVDQKKTGSAVASFP